MFLFKNSTSTRWPTQKWVFLFLTAMVVYIFTLVYLSVYKRFNVTPYLIIVANSCLFNPIYWNNVFFPSYSYKSGSFAEFVASKLELIFGRSAAGAEKMCDPRENISDSVLWKTLNFSAARTPAYWPKWTDILQSKFIFQNVSVRHLTTIRYARLISVRVFPRAAITGSEW